MLKETINYPDLYVSQYTPSHCKGYLIYVHGGPGSHSAYFENHLETSQSFNESTIGWVCYDQRGCGRSLTGSKSLSHPQNIADLKELVLTLQSNPSMNLLGAYGHSYGAWLLYELLRDNPKITLKAIFGGLSEDIKNPRNRSLLMDLIALKIHQPQAYKDILPVIESHHPQVFKAQSAIREVMDSLEMRKYFYWANLEACEHYTALKDNHPIKENNTTYQQVRESLYEDESALKGPYLDKLSSPVLWINGFQDFIMGGENKKDAAENSISIFYRSGHYPHLEEPERFISVVSEFLQGAKLNEI